MSNSGPSEEELSPIISFLSAGKFDEALKKVTTLSQKYPRESLLINICGVCYQGLGKLENAVKYYRNAIKIDPSYYKAHFNLGGAYQALSLLNDAIKSYKNTLSLRPHYVEAHNNIGSLYKELNQFDNAIKSFIANGHRTKDISTDNNFLKTSEVAPLIIEILKNETKD